MPRPSLKVFRKRVDWRKKVKCTKNSSDSSASVSDVPVATNLNTGSDTLSDAAATTPESASRRKLAAIDEEYKKLNAGTTKYEEQREKGGGPKEGGPKEGGPKEGGPKEGGPKEGGPKEGGPKEGGPKEGGPKEGGPKEGGPKEGGPKEGGPKEDRDQEDESETWGYRRAARVGGGAVPLREPGRPRAEAATQSALRVGPAAPAGARCGPAPPS
ncbi:translation initiation factor IF-2-like [Schistocerca gregaria]|uniref:translation initiation factor IF-2-like n=1 Tax=Schistocerca gregaria TaxID=7010 RepID=UPI00211E2E59|nr:translation initiation factor IF-2-like [Schistocerca gregaria]